MAPYSSFKLQPIVKNDSSLNEMIPLIYSDKDTNKTIVKLEASNKDQKKAMLVKELQWIRV